MAGTTIKGVGNDGNVQIRDMVTAAKQNAGTGFQAVWNKTQNNAQTTGNDGRTTDGRNDVRRGQSLRAGDRQRDHLAGTQEKSDVKAEDSDAKDLEKVQEVLGTIVQNLIGQITDTFSVSEEELQGVMDELGMTETDLMDPVQLNELLMAVSGAEDSFALLTDEGLYGNVKSILDLQKDLTAERSQSDVELPTVEQEPEEKIQAPVQNTQEEKTKDSGNRHESQTAGQQGNLLLQNLKEENFLSGLQQASQTEGTQTTDTQDIMRQIMDYMKVSVKADSSDLEMQLHPQSLGTLHVQVASKNGVVTANFITQNETVKAALESQMVQLKESFAEQGVKVEAIEVTVQTHPFEQNLEQGRGNQSDQESGAGVSRRRTRRINLNTAFAEDEPQTEEDRIAADIMSANGNTVDFTA